MTDEIRSICREYAPIAPALVMDGDQLIEDLGYTSVALVELIFAIEEYFSVDLLLAGTLEITTVADVINSVLTNIDTESSFDAEAGEGHAEMLYP